LFAFFTEHGSTPFLKITSYSKIKVNLFVIKVFSAVFTDQPAVLQAEKLDMVRIILSALLALGVFGIQAFIAQLIHIIQYGQFGFFST
jgi:hypothetical protein